MRKLGVVLVAAFSLVLTAQARGAGEGKEKPDGTIKLSTGSVAAGVGFSWGSGVLTYQGKKYPISIDGLSVGDVGISKASATGKVYHLNQLSDFARQCRKVNLLEMYLDGPREIQEGLHYSI